MPLLIIDFRIHWRYKSTCKSSTCTVKLQELCRPCRTKWIWEILGDMNQLTLPRLGGWVWLKIERMTLLFKVLKLPDTSCVFSYWSWLLTESCWFTELITTLGTRKYTTGIYTELRHFTSYNCPFCFILSLHSTQTRFTYFERHNIRWCREIKISSSPIKLIGSWLVYLLHIFYYSFFL